MNRSSMHNSDLKLFTQKLLILLCAGGVVAFFFSFGALFLPIVAAFIVSLFFVPLLDKLNKHGIGDGVGIAISLFTFLAFVSTVIFLVVPIFAREVIRFFNVINEFLNRLQTALQSGNYDAIWLPSWMLEYVTGDQLNQVVSALSANTSEIVSFISGGAGDILQASKGVFVSVASTTFLLVTTIILIIFFLSERRLVARVFRSFLPKGWLGEYDIITHEAYQIVGRWAKGQAILSLSIFVLTFVLLHIVNFAFSLGMTNILTLAFLAGLLENVPYLWPILSLIPALAIALGISTKATVIVVITYFLIQQTENNFLVPKVMAKALSISSLLTLIVMFIATGAFGLLWTLLAVPMTAVIELLYHRFQIYKNGGEFSLNPSGSLSYMEERAYNSVFARLVRRGMHFIQKHK